MAKYFDGSRKRHIMLYCMSEEFAIRLKGISMRDDICREAKQLIQSAMEGYISGNPEVLARLLTYCSPDVLVIGTGRHEFYLGLEALREGMRKDQEEADGISFVIREAWYEAKLITENSCVVYGEFKAREKDTDGKEVIIDMDTRITAGLHRDDSGRLVIDSLHQSVPYIYQQKGEYYPKTIADQAAAALERTAILERTIQLYSLTGLYNRKYTEMHITRLLTNDHESGLMFVIDMDDFKKVNDTHGHLKGDELLKEVGAALMDFVPPPGIAGRIGGDEFMIFMPGPMEREQGENKARILIQSISRILLRMGLDQSCSIGITQIRKDGGTFDRAYRRADEALYRAKTSGKNMFCWRDGDGEEWGCRNGEEGTIP